MTPPVDPHLLRQVLHWMAAADRLGAFGTLAARPAWVALGPELGQTIFQGLHRSVDRLRADGAVLRSSIARTDEVSLRNQLVHFRRRYLRTETVVDFYVDCVNTRSNPEIAARLQAIDILAQRAMAAVLDPLGRPTPPVLTYLDRGLGASILKAGLPLWDGSANFAALIKITHHNLYRPTSVAHEAAHMVAHLTGWTDELAALIEARLSPVSVNQATLWAGWTSEMVADALAVCTTGYASVASLHDVLAGDRGMIFRYHPSAPHPVPWLRVLLGVQMCRNAYGDGPWEDLAASWQRAHPIGAAPEGLRGILRDALLHLPQIAGLLMEEPLRAFGGRTLAQLVDPRRVGPMALRTLQRKAGRALFHSPHWLTTEPLRLLALTGLDIATCPERVDHFIELQDTWMRRLSGLSAAA